MAAIVSMTLFRNLSVRLKILSIAAVGIVGFAIYLTNSYIVASNNAVRMDNVRDIYFPVLEKTDANLVRLDKIKESLEAAVSSGEMDILDETDKLASDIKQAFTEVAVLELSAKEPVAVLQKMFDAYYVAAITLSKGMINEAIPADKIAATITNMRSKLEAFHNNLKSFREKSYLEFTSTIDAATSEANRAMILGLVIGIIVVLLIGGIASLVASLISNDLRFVSASLKEMSTGEGDLTKRLSTKSNDEIGELVKWFNAFVERLQSIISEVGGVSDLLSKSTDELSTVADVSKMAVDLQMQRTEQVATAMNEMTATVQSVASHAGEAANSSRQAHEESSNGIHVVNQTINTIDSLSEEISKASEVIQNLQKDSENIGTVLDVIKAIAEQTNLLALNAAIEAARAGEQGRGFAVVADEVRSLASRTQQSTQEIQQTIEQLQARAQSAVKIMESSSHQADESVKQAAIAGASLQAITESVSKITEMNIQIANAAEEQSSVTEDVSKNIIGISDTVQESVNSTHQISEASSSLVRTTVTLNGLIEHFKV